MSLGEVSIIVTGTNDSMTKAMCLFPSYVHVKLFFCTSDLLEMYVESRVGWLYALPNTLGTLF